MFKFEYKHRLTLLVHFADLFFFQEADSLWETVSIWSDDVLKYEVDDKRGLL